MSYNSNQTNGRHQGFTSAEIIIAAIAVLGMLMFLFGTIKLKSIGDKSNLDLIIDHDIDATIDMNVIIKIITGGYKNVRDYHGARTYAGMMAYGVYIFAGGLAVLAICHVIRATSGTRNAPLYPQQPYPPQYYPQQPYPQQPYPQQQYPQQYPQQPYPQRPYPQQQYPQQSYQPAPVQPAPSQSEQAAAPAIRSAKKFNEESNASINKEISCFFAPNNFPVAVIRSKIDRISRTLFTMAENDFTLVSNEAYYQTTVNFCLALEEVSRNTDDKDLKIHALELARKHAQFIKDGTTLQNGVVEQMRTACSNYSRMIKELEQEEPAEGQE